MSSYYGGPPRRMPAEFVGVPTETLQQWLTEAQTILQQLSLGANPNAVTYTQGDGSKSVTYQLSNIGQLQQRIDTLAYALGLGPRRYALRPGF
jgi:hypothetical protein